LIEISAEIGRGSIVWDSTEGRVDEKGDQDEITAVKEAVMTHIRNV